MHCQILTFTIDEMTDDAYTRVCAALNAECAGLSGLVAQQWAVNPATHALTGTLRWSERGNMYRARQAAEYMTASIHFSPTPVTQRDIRLPQRVTAKPATVRPSFPADYDPRG
jgi:hypothetical protein